MNINQLIGGRNAARWARVARCAGLLAALSSLAACPLTKGPETGFSTCLYVGCPAQTCTTTYTIDPAHLVACYGWDPEQQTWGNGAPDAIGGCTDASCTVSFDDATLDPEPACAWGDPGDDADAGVCRWNGQPNPSQAGEVFAEKLDDDCNIDVGVPVTSCAPPATFDVELTTLCDDCGSPQAKGRPPGTTATLVLDAARSYLGVTTLVQSVSVQLSGTGFADLPSGRLLGAQVAAERARMAGSDWSSWSFALGKSLQLARTGDAFRISVAQKPTVTGIGRRDGKVSRIRALATSDVTGHLWVSQGAWDLDFLDQGPAGGFVMHLAGRIAP